MIQPCSLHPEVPRFSDPASFVHRLTHGDCRAIEELYVVLRPIVNHYTRNSPVQDAEDVFHELLMVVLERLARGELREPSALVGYLHGVVRRQVATRILRIVQQRNRAADFVEATARDDNPERDCLRNEQRAIIERGLHLLAKRDSELLTRFYLRGEDHEHICREMQLTSTQFRVFKSRAKKKLTQWAQSVA